jgi:hypothetical protein
VRRALAAALLLVAACRGASAGSPAGELRFHNHPPVQVVDDRRDLPAAPRAAVFVKEFHHFDGRWYRRVDRWMQMRPPRRAANVNAVDQVPDSTWFTNRIGARELTVEELAVGPNVTGSPEAHRPWRIVSSKVGGSAVGFVIADRRGIRYLLKFDQRGAPEVETGADVIAQRLLWAAGYNVPEDYLVRVRRQDLVVAPGAVVVDALGREQPMTAAFVDRALAGVEVAPDGTIRGLASQFLPGRPLGGHPREGVREGDPNDRVPHELRRELRGAHPIFAWVDHRDIKEDNTVDTYVADPADPAVHYVVHYLVDFGKALGAMPYTNCLRTGGLPPYELSMMARSLVTLGVWQRSARTCRALAVPGVALDNRDYDPARWRPNTLSYFPIDDHDRFDGFWGAAIVARFTPALVRAAVDQARFSDPRAARRMTELLLERRRATLRTWFAQVSPLDRFAVAARGGAWRLCFDDLAVLHGLVAADATAYRARAFDHAGRATGWRRRAPAAGLGRSCLDGLVAPRSHDGYTIVELAAERAAGALPPVLVHLAREPASRAPRVIGVWRR